MTSKFYIDGGTTYSKILELKENGERVYSIYPTSVARKMELKYELACGHLLTKCAKKIENEVVALAYGAKQELEAGYVALDLGSRDIKWAKYKDGKFSDMDWNSNCASSTGATIEMLLKFYDVKLEDLKYERQKYAVTCGIFGLEKIMEEVSAGLEPSVAISKFVAGIAHNAYNFTKCPEKIAVSGGFCNNACFIDALKELCEVKILGRYVLLDGLILLD